MKYANYSFIIFTLLLFANSIQASEQRAINISLSGSDGQVLPEKERQAIRQLIATAISQGVLTDFIVYNQPTLPTNQFFACVQASSASDKFIAFVNNLHAASPTSTTKYTLRRASFCQKDNTLVCNENTKGCLTNTFVTSGAYSDFVIRQQFANAMADISGAKSAMDLKFNADNTWTSENPADIGLPTQTDNCSLIRINANAGGIGTIICTVKGNPAIEGKQIDFSRNIDSSTGFAKWTCISNVDARYTLGRCDWY